MNTTLKGYFLRILTTKDYSIQELTEKALAKEYSHEEIEECIQYLIKERFVNEYRMAENLVYAFQDKKGKIWLKQKLRQRKLPESIIDQVLNEINTSEIPNNLKATIAKKYHIQNWKELDIKTKQKIVGYLQRQGYSNAFSILKEWEQDLDES